MFNVTHTRARALRTVRARMEARARRARALWWEASEAHQTAVEALERASWDGSPGLWAYEEDERAAFRALLLASREEDREVRRAESTRVMTRMILLGLPM